MSVRLRALALSAVSLGAAIWAAVLVDAHRKAVFHQLEPGVLCGADGGCGAVLASDWSTIGGVAVSAPAIPLYALLAFVALAAAIGRIEPRRAAGIVAPAAAVGVAFSLGLLTVMLGVVGEVCRYCLVMDGLALATFVLALTLHPLRALRPRAGELLGVAAAVLAGTIAFRAAVPEPREPGGGVVVIEEGAPEPAAGAGTVVVRIPKRAIPDPLGPDTPISGSDSAPVTIVVFEDFECPHCRRLSGYLHAVRDDAPDAFRLAFRHFPMNPACNPGVRSELHPDACRAAIAGECARRQGRFWEMYDVLFRENDALGDADLARHAAEAGLDAGAFAACVADPSAAAAVVADARAGAALGINGTPTLFVNGRRFVGAQSVPVLEALIDALDDRAAPRAPPQSADALIEAP